MCVCAAGGGLIMIRCIFLFTVVRWAYNWEYLLLISGVGYERPFTALLIITIIVI